LKKYYWYIILIVFLATLSAGIISFFIIEPVYEASTVIMVSPTRTVQRSDTSDPGEAVSDISWLPEITINNVIRQIKNPELMARVIRQLDLNREIYTSQGMLQMITVQGDTDTRGGGSSMIDIKVQHTDPAMAANLANCIREQYLDFVSEKNYEQMSKSLAFLSEQIAEAESNYNSAAEELKAMDEQPRGVFFLEKEIDSKLETLNQFRVSYSQLIY
jgi:capsular polysaccharide biosynthesis protein